MPPSPGAQNDPSARRSRGQVQPFWKVLGAQRPPPADCLREVDVMGARKDAALSRSALQGFCSPGWAWRGQRASAVLRVRGPSASHFSCCLDTVSQSLCGSPVPGLATMQGLWEPGPTLGSGCLSARLFSGTPRVVGAGLSTGHWAASLEGLAFPQALGA